MSNEYLQQIFDITSSSLHTTNWWSPATCDPRTATATARDSHVTATDSHVSTETIGIRND